MPIKKFGNVKMIQNPSKYQLDIFDKLLNTNSNIVINATAGSSKTTTIITGSKLLSPSISSVFVAFNKSIVEELKTKLPQHVTCRTVHSFGFSALTEYYRIPFQVSPLKNLRFIDDKLKIKDKLSVKQKIAYKFMMQNLIDLVRMNMLPYEPEVINQLAIHHCIDLNQEEILDSIDILNAVDFYNKSFSKKHNLVDFTDMVYLAALNPRIKLPSFDCVFLDEMQDVSKMSQLLVEKLIKPSGRLISVGDKNQSIYGFAGADGNSFDYFLKRSNTIKLPLSISYRCSKAIVTAAAEVYPDIEPYEKNEEGEVRQGSPDEIQDNDLVICRTTRPLVFLYFQLLERNQPAIVIGKDIEVGLLKVLDKVVNCDVLKGLEKLSESLMKLKQELLLKGIKNTNTNKKYIHLFEQVQVIIILSRDCTHMSQVESKIQEMFKENKANAVKLMTIHRSKGLENNRVFVIERFDGKTLMPSVWATQPWEMIAEQNIRFVAYTRAKKSLIKLFL